MTAFKKIHELLSTRNITTITVDIFDTILMRSVWPEGLQFYESAKRSVTLFQKAIDPSITPYEIYSWREYIRREILTAKRQDLTAHSDVDLTLEEWFTELFLALSAKYTAAPRPIKKELLQKLITIELELEKEKTSPNRALIELLREQKRTTPSLKIFFVSDMYLTSAQISELLAFHNVDDIFDGGVSSTEAGSAKHTGRMFQFLQASTDAFHAYNASNNLHIGDNYHADVLMAQNSGSYAVHFHPTRLRRARTFLGRIRLKLIKEHVYRNERRLYETAIKSRTEHSSDSENIFQDLGFLFAQPMGSYLLHVGIQSKLVPQKKFLFVSSEATTFIQAGKALFGSLFDAPQSVAMLNRKRTIRAVAWKIISDTDESLLPRLITTVRYGELGDDRKELYDFLLTEEFSVDVDAINKMSEQDFLKKLHHDLQSADKKYKKHLKDDYDYVISTLPSDNSSVVICDVGWGGTIQAVYSIFAQLHNFKGTIEGLYLGIHASSRSRTEDLHMIGYLLPNVLSKKYRAYWNAVIWEYVYTNKFQYEGDEQRLGLVRQGLEDGYKHFRTIHISPVEYFDKVVGKKIKRLFQCPTDKEIAALGEIRYDFGFNNPQILQIVDTTTSRFAFWKMLITQPKKTLHIIVASNNWTWGYIRRFRLIGMPTLLRIIGKLKKENYI